MDSNTQHPKKRIRDHQQDTNLVNSPGANKKARRDTQPPLHVSIAREQEVESSLTAL